MTMLQGSSAMDATGYDWIFVMGLPEEGGFLFESLNLPFGAPKGFDPMAFHQQSPEACLPPEVARRWKHHLDKVLTSGQPLRVQEELEFVGEAKSYEMTLTPVRNKHGRIHRIAGVCRDVTALREAQAALQRSEERLALALEGTQQGLWDWDIPTGEIFFSPRWFGMLGFHPGEIPSTLESWTELIHPEDRAAVEGARQAHLEGQTPHYRMEYRLRTRESDWIWVFDAGKVAAWDAGERPIRMAGMATDITERRRAEESLRALVGGVVHEMRNPLYGILVNLDAIETLQESDSRWAPFLQALRDSAERISSLMNDLRDYGEPRLLQPEPTRVGPLLEEAILACRHLADGRSCEVHLELDDPALVLPWNPRRMHQVFRNLVENALQHTPRGSKVLLMGRLQGIPRRRGWIFSVEDEGPGFTPEVLARAFEPFFTRRKGGTGLGLSIVKRVVEEHGGTVTAANRPGGGACIRLWMPVPGNLHSSFP